MKTQNQAEKVPVFVSGRRLYNLAWQFQSYETTNTWDKLEFETKFKLELYLEAKLENFLGCTRILFAIYILKPIHKK